MQSVIALFDGAGHGACAHIVIDGSGSDSLLLLELRGKIIKIAAQQGNDLLHIQSDIRDLLPSGKMIAVEVAVPATQLARYQIFIKVHGSTPLFWRYYTT